jgi:hypothetical protein
VADITPPPAPKSLTVTNGELTWEAEADLESGLACFIIERDGKEIVRLPEKMNGGFGRPIFQGNSYSDTPEFPLVEMRFTDKTARPGARYKYRLVARNTAGLNSEPMEREAR